jgi:hypothetical protein
VEPEKCPKCGLKLSYDRYRSENECGEETLGDWYSTHTVEECCDELLVQLAVKDARIAELEKGAVKCAKILSGACPRRRTRGDEKRWSS